MVCPEKIFEIEHPGATMQGDTPRLRVIFNDDDEIIARLDECERAIKSCVVKNCPMCKDVVEHRIGELRQALLNHSLL